MTTDRMDLIAYGPVPSRRLGRSLGINNIPPKICSYSCVYCQLGRSLNISAECREFYPPEEIVRRVGEKVEAARRNDEAVDYLAFVPDGEPTLDLNLGRVIEDLRPLGVKIAIITNSSLIDDPAVGPDLAKDPVQQDHLLVQPREGPDPENRQLPARRASLPSTQTLRYRRT